jgi:hypothetical protein
VLFLLVWFLSGGNTPDYAAADQSWTTWAEDNQWKSRIGGFLDPACRLFVPALRGDGLTNA